MDATHTLAEFTHDLTMDALPQTAVDASTRMALDVVGSALAAWDAPGVKELRSILSEWGEGPSRVWVGGERLSPPAATLVNSSMAHALEYDDLHCELPIHSGVIMVPAVLAVADANPNITGADATVAIIAGTEIICRMARATRSYFGDTGFRGWNPSSVVAGFATAAATGRLLGLDAAGIARAMGLAYAQAGGNQECIAVGGIVKRMQPGMIAEAGVRAAWLAKAGVTGAVDAIEGKNGFYAVYEQGDYDADILTENLGSNLEIERVGFKRYPICGMAQPSVDILRDLQREHRFTKDDVESIEAYGSKFVSDMVGRPYDPGDNPDVDAQFSLQYCLATVLETGGIGLADLTPEHTLNPERRAFANQIPIHLDESLKGKWASRLELKLRNGSTLTGSREKAAGQSDLPLTNDELITKFKDSSGSVGPAMTSANADQLCDLLLELPQLATMGPLCNALVPIK
ncbi:MAG: MmgE/PrpD family protein [Rhodospirillaceae bacterium]|jgi:2-methylcitrate dehydratase PrpD|nr:MmgE/PrpD family protein [Rhodospirillaceae bacterium]MBT4699617.1 MmgE/PrpD family protein [Rhodospirillaceae bacterium]MBT6220229.1 MmgE/PrpD family protein [Rhodospirillaceae bacterium]MBT6363483.1 MmgE/PrpD family protein [Rhodospirillaceae bacterium]